MNPVRDAAARKREQSPMNALESFAALRPLLFAIAYRMLGTAAEADDVLQDAWLRWDKANPELIESHKAWLTTVVTRLCLDRLKSARATREHYVGPWLPEPVKTEERSDPDSMSIAFLVLLERLTPLERAAYLLHEVFDYSHAEVATVLDREEAACRQLFHRAQSHIREGRPRFTPTRDDHERLLHSFVDALSSGNLDKLEATLASDATLWSDGGGRVHAARRPLHGAKPIARLFFNVATRFWLGRDQTFEVVEVNGWPALVGHLDGVTNIVISIETDGEHITAIRNILNPEKLQRI